MNERNAREELKIWGGTPSIRELAPRKEEPVHVKTRVALFLEGFVKRNAIAILMIAALALEGWAVALLTERRVTKEVTATVTAEMRAGFQRYLEQQERERQAGSLLTGEASLQAAMDAEADALARLLYGYRNNSLRDRKTLIWCVLARVDSKSYPNTVEAVVNQAQQWMFYADNNPVRDDDRQIAMDQLKAWHDGKYPAGFSDDFVYAEWTANDIVLRNAWEKDSKTQYWRMAEG